MLPTYYVYIVFIFTCNRLCGWICRYVYQTSKSNLINYVTSGSTSWESWNIIGALCSFKHYATWSLIQLCVAFSNCSSFMRSVICSTIFLIHQFIRHSSIRQFTYVDNSVGRAVDSRRKVEIGMGRWSRSGSTDHMFWIQGCYYQ